MKNSNINSFIKSRNIVVPVYLLKLLPKLDISMEAFMFLMYLNSFGIKLIFDPNEVSKEYDISVHKIMEYIDILSNKGLINFEVVTNDKEIKEERLSLEFFYDKVSVLLMESFNTTDNKDVKNIFDLIEKEFGRVLSPIEYEIIKAWIETGTSEEIIKEAVKEAVYNGVTNLRYIDKIIYEWQKKGFKTKQDIDNNRIEHKEKSKKVEVFDYDWLEDDE